MAVQKIKITTIHQLHEGQLVTCNHGKPNEHARVVVAMENDIAVLENKRGNRWHVTDDTLDVFDLSIGPGKR